MRETMGVGVLTEFEGSAEVARKDLRHSLHKLREEVLRLRSELDAKEKQLDGKNLLDMPEQKKCGNGARKTGVSEEIIGDSAVMRGLKETIRRLALRDSTVLILGETGTGKELVARALHYQGSRSDAPFVCVNCPALSAGLLESELFGHEKGAFTGADRPRKGRFEAAGAGTILLDEISEIDQGLQAKLLRVLQNRTFERVGSGEIRETGARVIATTNRDLEREVREHRFRKDLYFRLNVVPLVVPPLREHKEDIPALVREFSLRYGLGRLSIPETAMRKFMVYDWPGNVRQLENTIERACALTDEKALDPEHLIVAASEKDSACEGRRQHLLSIEDLEKEAVCAALTYFDGHQERAAASLGITSRTLRNKMKRYELKR